MKKTLLALLALHALRLAAAPGFELAPQEAYYFLYSQHPALSYFDHPPAVAWLITPFAAVLGRSELAPRLASWLATLVTGVLFAALARRTLPRARRSWALLLAGTSLAAAVVSLIATPDVPLLLFWTLALVLLHRAVFEGRRADWLLAGLAMGLAFDAKYTAVFLQAGLGAFLLLAPGQRRWLRTPWPYLSILVAHLAMAPVYAWNATHGFASFLFQSAGRTGNVGGLGLTNVGKLLATQGFLLLPVLLVAVGWACARSLGALRRPGRRGSERVLFLACFAVPLPAAFGALSFFSLVKPNWILPAYVAGILLAVRLLPWRRAFAVNVALGLVGLAVTAVQVLAYPVPIRSDDTWYGWKDLAEQVGRRAAEERVGFVFAADDYKTTAELRFYSDLPVYAGNVLGRRALQFDYLGEDLAALAGQDALFLDSRPRDMSPERGTEAPDDLREHFASVQELEPILIRRRGEVVRKFLIFKAVGYRGPVGR